jgi:histidinol-phosphate/aromatic aminotransferase/cobyric acid decarboxylase-like protein
MKNRDQFVLSVISLAFALKKLVESDYYDESRHKLVEDFIRLKNRVQLHTKVLENKETAEKFQEGQRTSA